MNKMPKTKFIHIKKLGRPIDCNQLLEETGKRCPKCNEWTYEVDCIIVDGLYSQSEVDELKKQFKPMHECLITPALEQLQKELKDLFCEREELGITDFKEGDVCVCVPCEGIDFVFSKYLKGDKNGN